MYWMKMTLMEAGLFGQESPNVIANVEASEIFDGFQRVLRLLLPPSLGFQRIALQAPDVLIETAGGRFPIDAVSGGLSALMEVGWQVFLRSRGTESFTVCIDEPENHLHPELQRLVIPALLEAFPEIQFIVATHSPFIVTSVPESNVYVLQYDDQGQVFAELLDQANKAGSSNEVLRDVLGLEMTMPIWAQRRLEAIVDSYSSRPITEDMLEQLQQELATLGMQDAFPATARDVLDAKVSSDQTYEGPEASDSRGEGRGVEGRVPGVEVWHGWSARRSIDPIPPRGHPRRLARGDPREVRLLRKSHALRDLGPHRTHSTEVSPSRSRCHVDQPHSRVSSV
jgi:hypothetical protein